MAKNKIKLFEIIPSFGVGGGERVAIEIARTINKKDFDVTIVSLYSKDIFEYNVDNLKDIKIISLDKKKGFDLKIIFRLIKLFKREKPDVIHTHLYIAPYVLIPSIIAKVKKRVHTIHSIASKELTKKKRIIMYMLYHYFKFIPVAISPFVKETIEKEYHIDKNKIPCIYNGIDTKLFKNTGKKIKKKYIELVNVARFSEVKNHKLMLEAFAIALKRNENLKLKLVGDGPIKQEIEEKIKELKIEDKVNLRGMRQNVKKELETADIFIMTSMYEGLPMSVLEAMSMGLPIITTPAGGVVDIVKNEKNGIITNYNKNEIADAILKISTNDKILGEYSNNSLKLSKKYDVLRMTKDYEKLFRG